jgi:hypothetical protein
MFEMEIVEKKGTSCRRLVELVKKDSASFESCPKLGASANYCISMPCLVIILQSLFRRGITLQGHIDSHDLPPTQDTTGHPTDSGHTQVQNTGMYSGPFIEAAHGVFGLLTFSTRSVRISDHIVYEIIRSRHRSIENYTKEYLDARYTEWQEH